MNTDFIRPAIAIVLTACGIETALSQASSGLEAIAHCNSAYRLRY